MTLSHTLLTSLLEPDPQLQDSIRESWSVFFLSNKSSLNWQILYILTVINTLRVTGDNENCVGYQCLKAIFITQISGSFGWAFQSLQDSRKSASFSSKRVQSIFSPKVHLQFHKSNRFRRNQNAISILIICIPTMDNLISCKVGKPRPSFPRFYVFSNPALHFTQLLLLDNTTGRAGAATCILNSF